MSDLTAPIVRENKTALPDYTLSEPPFLAHLAVEEELNRDYRAEYVAVAVRADPSRFQEAMDIAEHRTDERPYAAMGEGYYARVLKRKDILTPFLVLACLKRNHPALNVSKVNALLTDDRYFGVQNAVLDLFGFVAKKAEGVGILKSKPDAPSTSPASSASSESGASDGTKSSE